MKPTALVVGFWTSMALVAVCQAPKSDGTVATHVTVDGDLVRYDPGRAIVVRGDDNKERTYWLSPGVIVPIDLRVGRPVTLYTEPARYGYPQEVARVVMTSLLREEKTPHSISGKVNAYEAGKAVTVTRGDGRQVSYLINDKSSVPGDLSIGQTIQVVPLFTNGPAGPFVQTITYITVKLPR